MYKLSEQQRSVAFGAGFRMGQELLVKEANPANSRLVRFLGQKVRRAASRGARGSARGGARSTSHVAPQGGVPTSVTRNYGQQSPVEPLMSRLPGGRPQGPYAIG